MNENRQATQEEFLKTELALMRAQAVKEFVLCAAMHGSGRKVEHLVQEMTQAYDASIDGIKETK